MDRVSVADMDEMELQEHITGIRARRLKAFEAYKEANEAKNRARTEDLHARLAKQQQLLLRDDEAVEKALTRMEKRASTITALKIQVHTLLIELGEYE